MATNGRGTQHHRERTTYWQPLVNLGRITCPLCNQPIRPGQPWDLDHNPPLALGGNPNGPKHPAHAHCNRAAGARIRNRHITSRLAL